MTLITIARTEALLQEGEGLLQSYSSRGFRILAHCVPLQRGGREENKATHSQATQRCGRMAFAASSPAKLYFGYKAIQRRKIWYSTWLLALNWIYSVILGLRHPNQLKEYYSAEKINWLISMSCFWCDHIFTPFLQQHILVYIFKKFSRLLISIIYNITPHTCNDVSTPRSTLTKVALFH